MPSKKVASAYVDLQLQTAQFKAAVGDATNAMKQFSARTREETEKSRESVRLLSESLGLGIPRGLQNIISKLPAVTTAMNLAFDGVVVFALIHTVVEVTEKVVEFAKKSEEASAKLKESYGEFGLTVQKTANSYAEKMLEAGIRTDDLTNNHLAALNKQLELIDMHGFDQLAGAFEKLESSADKVFDNLKSNWASVVTQFSGSDAAGFKGSLHDFGAEYSSRLAQGNPAGAQALLNETQQREEQNRADLIAIRATGIRSWAHSGVVDGNTNAIMERLRSRGITDYSDQTYDAATQNTAALEAQQNIVKFQSQQTAKERSNAVLGATLPDQKALFDQFKTSAEEHIRKTEEDTKQWEAALAPIFDTQQKGRDENATKLLRQELEQNKQSIEALREHAQIVSAASATSRASAASAYSGQAEDIKNSGMTPGRRIAALQDALKQEHDLESQAYADELALYNEGSREYQQVLAEKIKADAEYYKQQGELEREAHQASISSVFDGLVQRSQDFNTQFKDALTTTVTDINEAILKLLTTKNDPHPFRAAGHDIFAGVAKTGLQDAEGGLMKALGLGSGKPDGSHSNPIYTRDADRLVKGAGAAGSGLLGWANDSNFMGKLFGGKLFGPGGLFGGSGAIPDQSNGPLAKGLGMGAVHPQESKIPGIINTIGQLGVKFATAGAGGASDDDSGSGSYADVQNSGNGGGGFFNNQGDFISVPGMAGGGLMSPGDWYMTGEQGPELLQVGSTSRINNARDTAAMFAGGGGGDTHHHWNVDARYSHDPAATHAAVQRGIAEAVPHIVAATKASSHDDKRRTPVKH